MIVHPAVPATDKRLPVACVLEYVEGERAVYPVYTASLKSLLCFRSKKNNGELMSRIKLLEDHELSENALKSAKAVEASGGDTSTLRGLANRQDMFDAYFQFYMPARGGTTISDQLIELVRLRIARHNDCFT